MGDSTGIEWTDATWNPVRGCSRVSPGCGGPRHEGGCYAEQIAARFSDPGQPFHGFAERTPHGGRWTGKLALVEEHLTDPLRWRRPRKIFVNSMSDLFHEALPDEAIDKVFAVMALAPRHTFQVLTKRGDRMHRYLEMLDSEPVRDTVRRLVAAWPGDAPVPREITFPLLNVLVGVSVEDQRRADERREHLAALAAMGWRTFVSYEPALGPVDWRGWEFLTWLISGGESGPRARPTHYDWHCAARDFCAPLGIPYFFKQWGEHRPLTAAEQKQACGAVLVGSDRHDPNSYVLRVGKRAAGRKLDGIEHNAMPTLRKEPA